MRPTSECFKRSRMKALEERRFVCHHEGCDKAFRCGGNLKRHLESRVHRPKTIHECKLCGVVCPKLSVLKKHEATKRHQQRMQQGVRVG